MLRSLPPSCPPPAQTRLDSIHHVCRSRAEVFILFDNYREAAPRASVRLQARRITGPRWSLAT